MRRKRFERIWTPGMILMVAVTATLVAPARCDDLGLDQYYEPNRCGPIALYCVCKSYGIETTIDELSELAEFDGRETSVAGLIKAAEAKGLKAEAYESSLRHLTSCGGPAIIDYPRGHFCAFMGWEGLKARILDPPKESELISLRELYKYWGGHIVRFSKPSEEDEE